uniref:RNA-binding S4 domain-containing protein n=1 Tax=Hanusia phi TaxID=3032 RepID=A0A7S0NE27_9CRYP|mmetsp:Transcript_7951/g.18133  ORF Transcript_7951/g.18133 Transcript_7951/m.18133 type:complete len:313 (+) Transcript_7951:128-1066(+)
MNKLDLARRPMSAASLLTWGGGIVWRKLQIGSGSFRDLCKPAGTNEEDQLVNINKLMSMKGICSRREANEFVRRGLVEVDGRIAQLGDEVSRDASVRLLPKAEKEKKEDLSIMLHKPVNWISQNSDAISKRDRNRLSIKLLTLENQSKKNVLHTSAYSRPLVPASLAGLACAGRLDFESSGLLIFTQDGVVARKLIGQDSVIEKEYHVTVRAAGSASYLPLRIERLRHGLVLDEKPLKAAQVDLLDKSWVHPDAVFTLRFVLSEGRYRQIRRMCDLVGMQVIRLHRVRVGDLLLGDLEEGKWREIDRRVFIN